MPDTNNLATSVTQVADEVNRLALEVDDLKKELTLEQLTSMMDWCDALKKVISIIQRTALLEAADKFPRDGKQITWSNALNEKFVTELKWSSIRTSVQRDDLYKAVKATARVIDTETGEVTDDLQSLIDIIEKTFRLEPRWTEIKELGINPDEFCTTKLEPKVITTKLNNTETGEAF